MDVKYRAEFSELQHSDALSRQSSDIIDNLRKKYSLNDDLFPTPDSIKRIPDPKDKPQKTTSKKPKNLLRLPNNNNPEFENLFLSMDPDFSSQFGVDVTPNLGALGMKFKIEPQIVPNLISWTRTDDLGMNIEDVKESVLFLRWGEVVNSIVTNSFTSMINSIREILPNKTLFLGIFGMEKYFKFWKGCKQSGRTKAKSPDKRFSEYVNSPKITKRELEFALTELQVQCCCCHRFLETLEDVVGLLGQFTKSIAKLPEKLKHRDKLKDSEWYVLKDNRDCVTVDKNGNGLQRLWQQQLTTFEMVRLEGAEAILAKYPTPVTLLNEYERRKDGSKVLEDIPIRRAAGLLTTARKIGPELSNKIHNFFNKVDADSVI